MLPSRAIELAAIYLDRNIGAILASLPDAKPNAERKQDLAAIIHLCGAAAAKDFARRGFRLAVDERCGDHDAATYLSRLKVMKRTFLRLAAKA